MPDRARRAYRVTVDTRVGVIITLHIKDAESEVDAQNQALQQTQRLPMVLDVVEVDEQS